MRSVPTLTSVLRTVAEKRRYVYPYVVWLWRSLSKLLSQRNYPAVVGLLTQEVVGRDLYLQSLRVLSDDGLVRRTIADGEMILDANDTGLSRRLIRYGVHEQTSTAAYRDELERLRDDVDGEVGVLELSANLGYFLLVAATTLGERATIYAIEPHPWNMELLRRNVSINGLDDRVHLINEGIGRTTGPAQLHVMPQSNWHTVGSPGGDYSQAVESIEIDLTTVDDLLDRLNLTPDDVHVVRFDIEDFEPQVFEGMSRLLDADTPLLLFVEFHPRQQDDETVRRMLKMLEGSGLEIVSAVQHDPIEWDGTPIEVQ